LVIFGFEPTNDYALVINPTVGASPLTSSVQSIPGTYYGTLSYDGQIMAFCDKTGTNCKLYKRANSASPYALTASSLGSFTLVNYISMSPDGAYLCLTRSASPTAVLLKKNGDDTYTDLSISQTDTFSFCDMSNDRAVFGGPTSIRILKKQNDGTFLNSQTISATFSTTSLKISYFGNWLMVGNNNNKLLMYSESTSTGNY
jgi:hypothetical protein